MPDGVELGTCHVRVVNAGHARAHLETQTGLVAQTREERDQVLGAHVEGDLTAIDDRVGHRLVE